jgi:pimeloyl-ACP methyl ester carboxylesterase
MSSVGTEILRSSGRKSVSVNTRWRHPWDIDTSTPIERTARKTAPLIQGSQLKVYEGAAHGLPITHAAQLCADLLAFAQS